MPKILLIDNYDSFTFNLYQCVKNIGYDDIAVVRNDAFILEQVDDYSHILISPGPGIPVEAGKTIPVIKKYAPSKSILGICLGHQAIAEAMGGKLLNKGMVIHGKSSPTTILDKTAPVFDALPESIETGRYHSWTVDPGHLPEELSVIAVDENQEIMGIRHVEYRVYGLQFHPESVLTPYGAQIIKNWLERT